MTYIHFSRDGQKYGPFEYSIAKEMVGSGQIVSTDLCWTEGLNHWIPVEKVPDFAALIPPAVPPQKQNNSPKTPLPPSNKTSTTKSVTNSAVKSTAPSGAGVRLDYGLGCFLQIIIFVLGGVACFYCAYLGMWWLGAPVFVIGYKMASWISKHSK